MASYKILCKVGADGTGFERVLSGLEVRAGRFANTLRSSVGNRLAGMFSLGALGWQVSKAIQYGSMLSDVATRSGETVEQIQRLNKSLEDTGSSLQELESFWEAVDKARMRALRDPEGREAAGFARFGIGRAELSSMGKSALTAQISAQFKGTENWQPLVSTLAGMRLQVGKLVESFRGGLYEMNADMAVMSGEQARILDDLGDQWTAFGRFISVQLAPVIVEAMRYLKTGWEYGKFILNDIVSLAQMLAAWWGGSSKEDLTDLAKLQLEDRQKAWDEVLAAWNPAKKEGGSSGIGADTEFEPLAAATSGKAGGVSPISDALAAVGNFMGTGRIGLETLASKQVQLLDRIAQNTSKMAARQGDFDVAI